MQITVDMTAEEFMEYMAWRSEKDVYEKKVDKDRKKIELLNKKILWAVDEDPKKPGKCKIIDHEHAAELVDKAKEFFA